MTKTYPKLPSRQRVNQVSLNQVIGTKLDQLLRFNDHWQMDYIL